MLPLSQSSKTQVMLQVSRMGFLVRTRWWSTASMSMKMISQQQSLTTCMPSSQRSLTKLWCRVISQIRAESSILSHSQSIETALFLLRMATCWVMPYHSWTKRMTLWLSKCCYELGTESGVVSPCHINLLRNNSKRAIPPIKNMKKNSKWMEWLSQRIFTRLIPQVKIS